MTRAARPYLVADDSAVDFGGWSLMRDATVMPLPEALPDWDANTDLRLMGSVRVDHDLLAVSTQVDSVSELRLVVSWRSVDGRIGMTAMSRALDDRLVHTLDIDLPGRSLGPEIDLAVRVVLASERSEAAPGVARLAGSVLWEHVTRLVLVGTNSRFPVVTVDFGAAGLDRDASWVLQMPDRLEAPVLGELLLLVNARDSVVASALTGTSPDADTVQSVFERLSEQLLEYAAECAADLGEQDWEPGSFGAVLLSLADRVVGGAGALRTLREQNPTKFRALLAGEARRNAAAMVRP